MLSLGNHEFDFGLDALKAMSDALQFPILDANILNKETGEPYLQDPYSIHFQKYESWCVWP